MAICTFCNATFKLQTVCKFELDLFQYATWYIFSESISVLGSGHASYFCRRVTASCRFTDASSRCFFNIFSRCIVVSRHASHVIIFQMHKKNFLPLKCALLKTCFNANTDVHSPSILPGGQLLSLLSVKLIIQPPHPPLPAAKNVLPFYPFQ